MRDLCTKVVSDQMASIENYTCAQQHLMQKRHHQLGIIENSMQTS